MQELVAETNVAGVSFPNEDGSSRQDLVGMLTPPCQLKLEREPKNKYDKNAIKIIGPEGQLGYVPKKLAARLAPLMDKKKKVACLCVSTGVGNKSGLWGASIRIGWKE